MRFYPAKKSDRISGWQEVRRLFANAGKPDVPGVYVLRACEYFWAIVPYLARDQKRIEDVDSSGPDHAANAIRYGILQTDAGDKDQYLDCELRPAACLDDA